MKRRSVWKRVVDEYDGSRGKAALMFLCTGLLFSAMIAVTVVAVIAVAWVVGFLPLETL